MKTHNPCKACFLASYSTENASVLSSLQLAGETIGVYRDNGKENGNHHNGSYRGYT